MRGLRGAALVLISALLAAEVSASPQLELMGVVWKKPTLRVLVKYGAPLDYIAAATRAFKLWKAAINYFTRLYGYEYLRKLHFEVYIEGFNSSPNGYDVIVEFLDEPSGSMELGEAMLIARGDYVIRAEIKLFLRDYTGVKLEPLDVLNVALHEVGHVLCLGHASRAHTANGPELMYHKYTPTNMVIMPSTLDIYGLALVFEWLTSNRPAPPVQRIAELPPNIPYRLTAYYYVQVISAVDSVRGGGWYLENDTALLSTADIIVRDDVRYVFKGWSGDVMAKVPNLSLEVTRNYTLVAQWVKQYKVQIVFTSADGLKLSPQPTLLMLDGKLVNESVLWLEPGEHVLEWVLWRGAKVRALTNLMVEGPGAVKVPLAIWRPLVRVTDILGLPVPFAEVEFAGPVNARIKLGLDAYGRAPELPEGVYEATVALGGLILSRTTITVQGDGVLTLRVVVNPYVLALALLLATLIALALRRGASQF